MPWAIANAAHKRQKRNPGVTKIVKIPNRGHALIRLEIDDGVLRPPMETYFAWR